MKIKLSRLAAREVARSIHPYEPGRRSGLALKRYCHARRRAIAVKAISLLGHHPDRARDVVAGMASQISDLSIQDLLVTGLSLLEGGDA